MNTINIWWVIFLLVLATFIARSGFWLVGHRINLPARVQQALRYAPACALAALIIPELLSDHSGIDFSAPHPKLLAGIAATLFFMLRKNMLQTIVLGMAVYTVLRLLW